MDTSKVENFFYYLQDKVKECYKQETKQAIERFIEELKGGAENVSN